MNSIANLDDNNASAKIATTVTTARGTAPRLQSAAASGQSSSAPSCHMATASAATSLPTR